MISPLKLADRERLLSQILSMKFILFGFENPRGSRPGIFLETARLKFGAREGLS